MIEQITLDVGCGDEPRGDVNIDVYLFENPELDQTKIRFVDVKSIPNFIRADSLHLPFRDKSFSKVFCYHVIEHVSNPHKLVFELLRVCYGEIELRCPHRFSNLAKMPYHRNYFNKEWFLKAFKSCDIHIETTWWYPFGFLSIIRFPDEIRVRVRVERRQYLNRYSESLAR